MAQPSAIEKLPAVELQSGCALAIWPADPAYDFEIQRAPDSGGSPDEGSAETVARIPGTQETFVDERPATGATSWYRIRHVRDGETASSWTPWVALTPQLFARAWRPAPVLPSVHERPTDDGATGTLTLEPTDPQHRLLMVEAKSRSGNGTEDANWTELTLAGGVYTRTVDLALKHPSAIRYRLTHYNDLGEQVTRERAVSFPLAAKPAKPVLTLSLDNAGVVDAHLEGDPDTAGFRVKALTSGYPTEAQVDAMDLQSGQSVDVAGIIDLADKETAYVTAKAYPAAGSGSDMAKGTVTYVDPTGSPHAAPEDPELSDTTVVVSNVEMIA